MHEPGTAVPVLGANLADASVIQAFVNSETSLPSSAARCSSRETTATGSAPLARPRPRFRGTVAVHPLVAHLRDVRPDTAAKPSALPLVRPG